MQNRGKDEQEHRINAWMAKIKHKIVVLSGKGGVGKSTVAANLAVALARKGRPNLVGILDADITGPSIPKMLGARKQQLRAGPPGIFPATGPLGIKIVSMDFLLQSDETPIIWRGPLKSVAIKQFLADVVWGELEFLLIDLPPGTGDEALSIMQLIPDIDGVIIITIPSEVSQIVVKKAVTFTRKLNSPIIGIIENMSGFVCPKCGAETNIFKVGGGQKISDDLDVPFLGRIPLDPRICEGSDQGSPFIIEHSDSPAAKAFVEIVDKIEDFLKKGETHLTLD
ncbi:MAG: Mrp/NBP35 family ATP-binding protein [archaeon]|nr:Mrp/NBP35 family ATP-binding protein [archaeon]MCP8306007.1 Mrp/NBP35 family ATP-binding protein [archaeon]